MTARRYDILALDLDGTLLDSRGRVSERNVRAVHAARAAGLRVVVCTGRGLVESRHILETIDQRDPVVVAGGSIIADPTTARTIHRFAVDRAVVHDSVRCINEGGHPALVLKDPLEAGYDYLVVQGPGRLPLDPVTAWWFESLRIRARFADHLREDEHQEHTVRIGACGLASSMARVKADLAPLCDGRAFIHHFSAVISEEHAAALPAGETVHVLEVFDAGANKWTAVDRLARGWGVDASRIAAIGDEVNDESMIRHAGLGVAMGNAVPRVQGAATRRTRTNDEDGVAHAIENILRGEW